VWIVAKYKPKEFKIFKESFFKILGEMPEFYNPKIKYERYIKNKLKIFEKNILNNYIICKHDKFNNRALINVLKNSRGITYFLKGCEFNQKELHNFIRFCKFHEDENGFLRQDFFKLSKKDKAKFISGPFTQMIFDIIEDKGKKLKILINNMNMTISKSSSNLLYSYI
jgi:transcription antitermination factor NusG